MKSINIRPHNDEPNLVVVELIDDNSEVVTYEDNGVVSYLSCDNNPTDITKTIDHLLATENWEVMEAGC